MKKLPLRRILIVDHAAVHRRAYQLHLQSDSTYQYRFLEATSATEGLALCRDLDLQDRTQQVDGILLEYNLPDLDGIRFLAQLKAQMGELIPPVVMINGSNPQTAIRALKSGVEDYLIQDQFTPDDLRLAVRSAIENAQLRQQLQTTEQALRQSEVRYRAIVEDQTELICRFLPDATLTFVNFAYCRYFNVRSENLLGQSFLTLVPERSQTQVRQQIAELLTLTPTHPVLVQEHEVINADGTIGWQQWVNRAIFDSSKQLVEFQSVGRDITERKQAELKLQSNQAQMQRILEQAPIGISRRTFTGAVIEMNDAMLRLYGYTRKDFEQQGFNWLEAEPPETITQTLVTMKQLLQNCLIEPHEKQFIRKDGTHISVLESATLCEANANEHISFAVDLSDLKRAQLELKESEERFRLTFERAGVGIAHVSPTGNWLRINQKLCDILGYTASELREKTFQDITYSPDLESDLELVRQVLANEIQTYSLEKRYIRKDGAVIWANLTVTLVREPATDADQLGTPKYFISVVEDISDRKNWEVERERLLAEAQSAHREAEAANRSKDEFLAIVSHELRSPLNAILGWAKFLQNRPHDPATLNRALETIERNTKAQTRLIEDLLDISRMAHGSLRLNFEPVSLIPLIDATLTNLRFSIEAKQLNLTVRLDHSVGAITGDPARLQQVITNLVTNSIKFTPNHGRIEVQLEQYQNQAVIRVTDTGKGIAPEFLSQVFERFQQAETSLSQGKDGLGLGLAISRYLVELHGGMVIAESPGIDQGATFTIRLPLMNPVQSYSESGSLSGRKVLIVDDISDERELLSFALRSEGAIVELAASATAAIEQLQRFQPDILISDIYMPNEDGYSLLARIRQLPAERGGKVIAIAITASAEDHDRNRALAVEFQHYLTKPVNLNELIALVAAQCGT